MFALTRKDNGSKYAFIKTGVYKIGRLSGDIILTDPSISRKHAEIEIKEGKAYVKDCGSKYQTRINNEILPVGQALEVKDETKIYFGGVRCTIHKMKKIVTCTTGIKNNGEVETLVRDLGFGFSKEWDESCTHLTTNEIVVTLKLLYALIDNKTIVTAEYWKNFSNNMKDGYRFPDPTIHFPPVSEAMINPDLLKYNPKRQELFNGKVFGFWNKKRQAGMEKIITKAGGRSILLDKNTSNKEELLESMNNCIVVDPEDPSVEKELPEVFASYRKTNKRIIPVQEIVFALLQCSCRENCNPLFDLKKEVFTKETQEKKDDTSKFIINESQTQQSEICENNSEIIPSSYDQPMITVCDVTTTRTQISEETQIPSKKLKKAASTLNESRISRNMDNKPSTSKNVEVVNIPLDDVDSNITSSQEEPLKRRSEPDIMCPPTKKVKTENKNLKINPFSSIANVKSSVKKLSNISFQTPAIPKTQKSLNAFLNLNANSIKTEVKTEEITDENDSVIDVEEPVTTRKRNREEQKSNLPNKKLKEEKTTSMKTIDNNNLSRLSHRVQTSEWIDRTIKERNVKIEDNNTSLDEEMRVWCEKFNNSVSIVVKDLTRKDRLTNETVCTSDCSLSGGVNFKKFKKVPFRKSNVVIKCSELVPCRPRNIVDEL